MNNLLKWGIQNSEASQSDPNAPTPSPRGLDPQTLSALFGGPSDADLMKAAMSALHDPEVDLENKLIAFDNFEQLLESIDNANNLEPMGLWTPLVGLLSHDEAEMRLMAAWCVGTAVQNNEKAQDRLVVLKALPTLVNMATTDPAPATRKKAVYALSSASRNYQPALNEVVDSLPEGYPDKVDAADMDAIDSIMDKLKAHPVES